MKNEPEHKGKETQLTQREFEVNRSSIKSSPLLWFGLGVVVTLLLSGGMFFYTKIKPVPHQPQHSVANSSPSPDLITNWHEFTDPSGTYSFKYPGNWKIEEFDDANVLLTSLDNHQVTFKKFSLPQNTTLFNFIMNGGMGDNYGKTFWNASDVKLMLNKLPSSESFTVYEPSEWPSAYGMLIRFIENLSNDIVVWVSLEPSNVGGTLIPGQAEHTQIFTQILSTFQFTDQTVNTNPAASTRAAKLLTYQLPLGWKTVQDETGIFEVGYDPNLSLVFDTTGKSINPLNIVLAPVWESKPARKIGYGINVSIKPYDGGSRHKFINVSDWDRLSGYHEKEYIYNGWSCLVIYGVQLSQSDINQGMCAISNSQAFAFSTSTWTDDMMERTIQTIRMLK